MRACMAPSQIDSVNMAPSELKRAFQTLCLQRRGVILLDNVQSEDQISELLPVSRSSRCLVIVTSVEPLERLMARFHPLPPPPPPAQPLVPSDETNSRGLPSPHRNAVVGSAAPPPASTSAPRSDAVFSIEQRLGALPPDLCALALRGGHAKRGQPDDFLSDSEAAQLTAMADGLPLSLNILFHQLSNCVDPVSLIEDLSRPPSVEEKVLFTPPPSSCCTPSSVPRLMQHLLICAYSGLPAKAQSLFSRLHVFASSFEAAAVMRMLQLDLRSLKEGVRPLLAAGLVCEHEMSSVSRRKAQQARQMVLSRRKNATLIREREEKDESSGDLVPDLNILVEPTSRYWLPNPVREFALLLALHSERRVTAANVGTPSTPLPRSASSPVAISFAPLVHYYTDLIKTIDELIASDSKQQNAEVKRAVVCLVVARDALCSISVVGRVFACMMLTLLTSVRRCKKHSPGICQLKWLPRFFAPAVSLIFVCQRAVAWNCTRTISIL